MRSLGREVSRCCRCLNYTAAGVWFFCLSAGLWGGSVMSRKNALGYLREQRMKYYATEGSQWLRLEKFYRKRWLWHQLTVDLLRFVHTPALAVGDRIIKLYECFISEFEHWINPMFLVEILIMAAPQVNNWGQVTRLFERTKEKVKHSDEALLLCLTAIATAKMSDMDMAGAKRILDAAEAHMKQMPSVTPVHARFYTILCNYHQAMGQPALYYKHAFHFMSCVDVENITDDLRHQWVAPVILAALAADNVYNFGELLVNPVLKDTDEETQWLVDVVSIFHRGSVKDYDALKDPGRSESDITFLERKVRKKLQLICLKELAFNQLECRKPITFEEVAEEACLPLEEVELLAMKALSCGLIKGTIDEVDQEIHVTWVQPKVLDVKQIGDMMERFEDWCENITDMYALLEKGVIRMLR
ncbi:26S proteasome non-ATPase regulatory subunit 13-like [Arapaima gigas]